MGVCFVMYVCVCVGGFCNVWGCVGFVMCGCFDNCVGFLVICVLVFTVFCLFCVFIVLCMNIYSYLLLV